VNAPGAFTRWLLSVLALALVAVILLPLLRADRLARFWALGQLLALFPVGAVSPRDTYLFAAGLGVMGLAACFVAWLAGSAPRRRLRLALGLPPALAFLAMHLVVGPWQLHHAAKAISSFGAHHLSLADAMPDEAAVRQQTVVIPFSPSALSVAYSFYIRSTRGQPIAERVRLLAAGGPVELSRVDERTLIVRARGQPEQIFRPPWRPLRAGDQVALTGLRAEVRAVGADGWPTETVFRFDRPLEDASLRWLWWTLSPAPGGRYAPWTPPPVGGSVRVN
jgi:hypothetical protein